MCVCATRAVRRFNCVALLVDSAFDSMDEGDGVGDTPLHLAAAKGFVEIAQLLLQARRGTRMAICIRVCGAVQDSECERACRYAFPSCAVTCVSACARVPCASAYGGGDPRSRADRSQTAANPNGANALEQRPLHVAADAAVAAAIYHGGGQLGVADRSGRTPLFVACAMNRPDVRGAVERALGRTQ